MIGALASLAVIVLSVVLAKATADTVYIEGTTTALQRADHGWHVMRVWSGVLLGVSIMLAALRNSVWIAGVAVYSLLALFVAFAAPNDSTPAFVALALGAWISALIGLVTFLRTAARSTLRAG